MKLLEIKLGEWKAPQNELSRKATTIVHLPSMYAKRDYGKDADMVLHKVNIRSTKTGKSYGSKAIPERNLGEMGMNTTFLDGAIGLIKEAEERKALEKQLSIEHKGLKQQVKSLKKQVEKLKMSGGEHKGHPYDRALQTSKFAKKKIKKLRNQLRAGKSAKKVQKKVSKVTTGTWE